jgi:hypothetical protein
MEINEQELIPKEDQGTRQKRAHDKYHDERVAIFQNALF